MVEPLDDVQASRILKYYVCSGCWGHLEKYPAVERAWLVKCPVCGDETRGYVSKRYVERRLAESIAELIEARNALWDVMPGLLPRQSIEKNLKELGY